MPGRGRGTPPHGKKAVESRARGALPPPESVWQPRLQTILVMAVAHLLLFVLFLGDRVLLGMARGIEPTALDWVAVLGVAEIFAVAGLAAPRKPLAIGLAPVGAVLLAASVILLLVPQTADGAFPTTTASATFGMVAIVATGLAAAYVLIRTPTLAVPPQIRAKDRA